MKPVPLMKPKTEDLSDLFSSDETSPVMWDTLGDLRRRSSPLYDKIVKELTDAGLACVCLDGIVVKVDTGAMVWSIGFTGAIE